MKKQEDEKRREEERRHILHIMLMHLSLYFYLPQKDRSRKKNPNDDYMGHNPIVRST